MDLLHYVFLQILQALLSPSSFVNIQNECIFHTYCMVCYMIAIYWKNLERSLIVSIVYTVQITCARKGNRKRAYLLLIYIRLLIILNLKWISIQSSLLRYENLKMVDFSKLFGIIFQSVCKKYIINIMIWSRIFEVCVIDGMRVRWYLFLWWGLYL